MRGYFGRFANGTASAGGILKAITGSPLSAVVKFCAVAGAIV